MKANLFLRLALLAAAAAAAASCIYPFHPDVQGSDTRIVIEGSILAGASSTFSFSNVHPIGTPESYQDRLSFTGYIEGEDGSRIRPAGGEGTETLVFDTSDLPETQRYRVHLRGKGLWHAYQLSDRPSGSGQTDRQRQVALCTLPGREGTGGVRWQALIRQ